MTVTMTSTLSQEYFDETVLENEEVFDLSPEDAVTETIDQLFKQQQQQQLQLAGSSTSNDEKELQQRWEEQQRLELGVSLTHPESPQGKADRERQQAFHSLLQLEEWSEDHLDKMFKFVKEDNAAEMICVPVVHMFWQPKSSNDSQSKSNLEKMVQFVETTDNLQLPLELAQSALQQGKISKSIYRSRQEILLKDFLVPSRGWERLFSSANEKQYNTSCKIIWLKLIYRVCQGNEPNKKYCNTKPILELLIACLQNGAVVSPDGPGDENEAEKPSLLEAICNVVTVLCRFDDFSQDATKGQPTDSTGMVVSSAHSTVTVLGNLGIINALQNLLASEMTQTSQTLLLSTLQALRSLAIQDEMVQRMIGAGVLEHLKSTLQQYCEGALEVENGSTIADQDNVRLAIVTALIGLYRNMSANDELKTILCRSRQYSILGPLIATMQSLNTATNNNNKSASTVKLQEHVCATLGSMALRQPQNAQLIVEEYQGHLVILKAMEQCTKSMLVQRQGALAIRNLASRASDTVQQSLLDAGAEPILRQASTLGAMDEAYAALRDLGCPAVMLQTNPDTGKLERQPMFGEKPLQFRPVYD